MYTVFVKKKISVEPVLSMVPPAIKHLYNALTTLFTAIKTALSQLFYSDCWLCTCTLILAHMYVPLHRGADCAFNASDNFENPRSWAMSDITVS